VDILGVNNNNNCNKIKEKEIIKTKKGGSLNSVPFPSPNPSRFSIFPESLDHSLAWSHPKPQNHKPYPNRERERGCKREKVIAGGGKPAVRHNVVEAAFKLKESRREGNPGIASNASDSDDVGIEGGRRRKDRRQTRAVHPSNRDTLLRPKTPAVYSCREGERRWSHGSGRRCLCVVG